MRSSTTRNVHVRRPWAVVVLFNGLLLLWLIVKPGNHALVTAGDDVAQFLGPLILLTLFVASSLRGRPALSVQPRPAHRWALRLLALGVLFFILGQMVWTLYEQVLHNPPFPSWADVGFVSAYPC